MRCPSCQVMRPCLITVTLFAGLASAYAAPVWWRASSGKWLKSDSRTGQGRVTVTVDPRQMRAGTTTLVLGKPPWMDLEDREAPKLKWLRVGQGAAEPAGEELSLALPKEPTVLTFDLKDNANPIGRESVRFSIEPIVAGVSVDTSGLGPPRASGQLKVRLPALPAGRYEAHLQVADLSPTGNRLHRDLTIVVPGVSASPDLQEVRAATMAGGFVFRAKGQATLQIGDGAAAYLTSKVGGEHMYVERITEVRELPTTVGAQSVRIIAAPGQTDAGNDGAKLARLEYDLQVRNDLPCLLVRSRTVNLGPRAPLYCWWGWLPGDQFADSEGTHDWSGAYMDVGKVQWVYLTPPAAGRLGIGWLAPGLFGESRFRTMLLYTDPRTIEVGTGGVVEIPFAIMPAKSAADVAAVAEKIRALRLWDE